MLPLQDIETFKEFVKMLRKSEVKRMNSEQFQSAVLEKLEQLTTRMNSMEANTKQELAEIRVNMATKDDLARAKEIVVKIENEHGLKLGALFDGYTLNSEKLDRIERAVAKHEETLLTKVK